MKARKSPKNANRLPREYRVEWMRRIVTDRTIGTKAMQVALAFALENDWGRRGEGPDFARLVSVTRLSESDVFIAGLRLRDRDYIDDLKGWPKTEPQSAEIIHFPRKNGAER
jgi:hypothetical protein